MSSTPGEFLEVHLVLLQISSTIAVVLFFSFLLMNLKIWPIIDHHGLFFKKEHDFQENE